MGNPRIVLGGLKSTRVCFDCRHVARFPRGSWPSICPFCRKKMHGGFGDKCHVPKKNDLKGWRKFREQWLSAKREDPKMLDLSKTPYGYAQYRSQYSSMRGHRVAKLLSRKKRRSVK